jgi:hypothetical protein
MDTTIDRTLTGVLNLLTEQEASILDAAALVKFGELVNVEVDSKAKPTVSRRLTDVQIAFIKVLRNEGVTRLDSIIVHNGVPSQIEIYGMHKTIQYKRKIRFN